MCLNRLVVSILLLVGTAFAADAFVGRWRINIEKSKLRDPEAWKGRATVIEQVGPGTHRMTFETPNANGGVGKVVEIRSPTENPVPGTPGETSIEQRIDDYHRRAVFKRNGKEVATLESAISTDGKTMTNTIRGVGNDGKPFEEIRVFDKQ